MGSIRKKTSTKALPKSAGVFKENGARYACWSDSRGNSHTAEVIQGRDGSERIRIHSPIYTAKYRDANGTIHEVSTGCKSRRAALAFLRELEVKVEKIRSGMLSSSEAVVTKHLNTEIQNHFKRYNTKLESEDTTEDHRGNVSRCLNRIAAYCNFTTLADLKQDEFERYLAHRKREGDSARTRNLDRASLVAFCNWCVETHRLMSNPFGKVAKANEDADRRHERRAMTAEEIHKLLDAARRRPLLDAMTIRTGKRKGQLGAKIRDEVRADRIRLGNERTLIYSALVYTGLRKGELESLTLAHVVLDSEPAYLILKAKDEKAKRGANLPLHPALVEAIRTNLAEREELNGDPLPLDTSLFNVPSALSKIFNRDIELAGIEKRDALDRVVDVHSLRHSHASLLAKAGVAPAVAQKSMRHSDVKLTMGVYTHTELNEVAEAVSRLPELPVSPRGDSQYSPETAPEMRRDRQNRTIPDKTTDEPGENIGMRPLDVKSYPDKRKGPPTTPVNGPFVVGDTGLEPVTPSLSSTNSKPTEKQKGSLLSTSYGNSTVLQSVAIGSNPQQSVAVQWA